MKSENILTDIKIIDIALFLEKYKVLILGDTHIGFDAAIAKEGVLLPKYHFKDLMNRLSSIIEEVKPKKIVLNGDIKHEFGTISDEEWRNLLKLIDYISEKAELILVKGNHDAVLEPVAKKRGLKLRDFYSFEDIYVCHGHVIPEDKYFKKAKTVIISHDHPAISFIEGARIEKYKCFLSGEWTDKNLIVLPAFSPTTTGSDIFKEKMLSPMLSKINDFRVFVCGEKTYDFGLFRDLKEKLKNKSF